jgi:hypothetical protein
MWLTVSEVSVHDSLLWGLQDIMQGLVAEEVGLLMAKTERKGSGLIFPPMTRLQQPNYLPLGKVPPPPNNPGWRPGLQHRSLGNTADPNPSIPQALPQCDCLISLLSFSGCDDLGGKAHGLICLSLSLALCLTQVGAQCWCDGVKSGPVTCLKLPAEQGEELGFKLKGPRQEMS